MRWKGVIVLIVIIALWAIIAFLFMDKWVERGLEKTGELIVGARVEIDGFHFSLWNLSVEWDRLQVANPNQTMQNITETSRVSFRMNMPALLRRRYVIEEMTISDIRSGTPRETDGALPRPPIRPEPASGEPGALDKAKTALTREIERLPVMNFDLDQIKKHLNLDSLIVMADLRIVSQLDSVKKDVSGTVEKWQQFQSTFHPDQELQSIKADITSIDPKAIKDIPTLVSTLEKVKKSRKDIEALIDQVQTAQSDLKKDFDRFSTYTKKADTWLQEDYQRILRKARLPDMNVKNIGMILFGATLVQKVNTYISYVQKIRKYIPAKSNKPAKKKPPRLKGQDIPFPDHYGYPELLIKKIILSGQTGASNEAPGIKLSGNVRDLTSQPWVLGRPTRFRIAAERENRPAGNLTGILNHVTEVATDSFLIDLHNLSLNNAQLANSDYLPSRVQQGTAAVKGSLIFSGEQLQANLDIVANALRFDFKQAKPTDKFVAVVQEVINSMDRLTINARISGTGENLSFRLNSNIDDIVSRKLKSIGSKAVTDARRKIRTRLEKTRNDKLAEVNKIYQTRRREFEDNINKYKQQIDVEKQRLEDKIKEIQHEIDERRKAEANKVKDKAKKTIDKLLKKRP